MSRSLIFEKLYKRGDVAVSTRNPLPVTLGATASDAFARLRVSNPQTLFDSKQLFDNQPLYWDDQETSGSGTGSSHSTARASTTLSVSDTTAGKRVRQTYQRFNYQPGKSQLLLCTGVLGSSAAGIQQAMGQFDDNNGFFVRQTADGPELVLRSSVSGSPVETAVAQTDWNHDTLDGSGPSGVTLDLSKSIIWWCDYEWLGVGSVRMGFVVDQTIIHCHSFHHSNQIVGVYMPTPNLPVRYELENDGTGGAAELEHICCTIMSEGGQVPIGELHCETTAGVHVDANAADTLYALIGIRLRSGYVGMVTELVSLSVMDEQTDDYEWQLLWNPTVAGTFTYSDKAGSGLQTALGATANTVTGGTLITSGFVKAGNNSGAITLDLQNALKLGAALDGTVDEIVLCARPLSANADMQGSLTWRELR